jgi:hypothetical protein
MVEQIAIIAIQVSLQKLVQASVIVVEFFQKLLIADSTHEKDVAT